MRFWLVLTAALMVAPLAALAHFVEGQTTREIHVTTEPDWGEAEILLRFPMTYAFAHALMDPNGDPSQTSRYLANTPRNGAAYYHVDQAQFEESYDDFAAYLLKDYRFTVSGQEVTPELGALAMINHGGSPDRLPEGLMFARELLDICTAFPGHAHISELEVVVQVYLPESTSADTIGINVITPKIPLPTGMLFDTHITDHRHGTPILHRSQGFYPAPITLDGDMRASFLEFLRQGVIHIIEGLDHVLFVLCLTLAATRLRLLLWSVTGFTLGHSVTLAAGVLGAVPQTPVFIPAVELGVAASIAIMAGLVLLRKTSSAAQSFGMVSLLGLLHGFGFAFMLAPMLGGAAGVLIPLVGFNLGVELGQIAIVLVVFAAMSLLRQMNAKLAMIPQTALAAAAFLIALSMCVERIQLVYEAQTASLSQHETRPS